MHQDGKVPWCKDCVKNNSITDTGEIDEEKFKNTLRQIDRPYYKDYLQTAIKQFEREHNFISAEDIKYHGAEIIGSYFTKLNSLHQLKDKSYGQSEKDNFIHNPALRQVKSINNPSAHVTSEEEPSNTDLGDFEVTDEIRELFGDGYDDIEYKKMFKKYEKLKVNYPLQTSIHQEALATYVRFKVKEEDATAKGDAEAAKKWYDAANNAADKGKLTPKQLTKDDLQSGVTSISELVKTLEQAVDVIKILPQFKYRPNDAPDFNIWCYVNYERDLNGQSPVDYSEVYSFYDKKKKEYVEQNGDPYGIFDNDPTDKNRKTVKTFIKLPDDYDDLAGDRNGD